MKNLTSHGRSAPCNSRALTVSSAAPTPASSAAQPGTFQPPLPQYRPAALALTACQSRWLVSFAACLLRSPLLSPPAAHGTGRH